MAFERVADPLSVPPLCTRLAEAVASLRCSL